MPEVLAVISTILIYSNINLTITVIEFKWHDNKPEATITPEKKGREKPQMRKNVYHGYLSQKPRTSPPCAGSLPLQNARVN